ncbi:hybrid sensor histidine kinase/response regulator [Phenylobacterium montanum]|uniref:histidine kinase n=1 Tax=Phenylobacterium montanum TaxID=2823693 RepID=A0A975G2C9_9CAUL|nr:hybrid sensor histidine kinase/response regulator [Caulobacter sp. S6]QUD89605.1 response regulator [Caulobacter sp. S6]
MLQTKIMVVEDERIVALNLKQRLARMGYEVTAIATSGPKALAAIATNRPDIVLMDIHIDGDMDGIDTAAAIPPELHLPVVYLTAYSEEATLERARETQPYGYLLKPFSERELHATLKMVMERRRADGLLRDSEAQLEALVAARTAELAAANAQLQEQIGLQRKTEAALHQAQKMEAIGQLTGGVAHHFNNLLTVVLGNLQLAKRRAANGEDVERFLVSAIAGAQRGADVVKQLLTFSRQQVLESRVIDLAQWMPAASTLLANAFRSDIAVEVEVASPTWPIHVDPAQLELALLNLAVNARDAMPGGGVLHISAANRSVDDEQMALHGDYVVIEVADTGEGVDPEIVQRVFEPFFTTKELGPGAGLGLSQVQGFIHQSGGAVDLTSVVGQGTTVRLYLPAAKEAVTELSGEPLAHQPVKASGRVLVVDDDVEVASLTGQLLEGCGYTVKLVPGAKVALDLLEAGEPVDLLFSDIIMPGGMNGVELAEAVRRRFPGLPILLATGYSDAGPLATAKGLQIIAKPYDADALCLRVREIMLSAAQGSRADPARRPVSCH